MTTVSKKIKYTWTDQKTKLYITAYVVNTGDLDKYEYGAKIKFARSTDEAYGMVYRELKEKFPNTSIIEIKVSIMKNFNMEMIADYYLQFS